MIRHVFHWLLVFAVVFAPFLSEAAERPILRVGYTDVHDYISKGEDGNFRGFLYDYLEALSTYSGHTIEYVPCDSPSDSIGKMMRGEIDMVAAVPDVKNPPQSLALSPRAVIYAPIGVVTRDGESFENGKHLRIGFPEQLYDRSEIVTAMKYYGQEEGTDYELVAYPMPGEMVASYRKGELDGYVDATIYNKDNSVMVAHLFSYRFATAVRKDNPELQEKLNRATDELLLINPRLREQLYAKYFNDGTPLLLTEDEKDYIREHPVFSAVVSPDQKPYTYYENGEAKGVIAEVAQFLENRLGIRLEMQEVKSREEIIKRFRNGEIDIVVDCFDDYNWSRENNALLSFPYLRISYVPVTRRGHAMPDKPVVACARGFFYTHEYVERHFPEQQRLYFATIPDCLAAVNDGTADVAFINSITVQHEIEKGEYMNLHTNGSEVYSNMISLAVSKNADPRLIRILDKAVNHLGDARMEEIVTRHVFEMERNRSFFAYVMQNPWKIFAIVAMLLLVFIYYKHRMSKEKYQLAFHNHLTGLPNIRWFEDNASAAIRENAADRKAGRLFVMVVSTRRIDLLKASLAKETLASGMRELVEGVVQKNPWILASGISSELTHYYVLGRLEEGMGLRDMAERLAHDAMLLHSKGYDVHMEYYCGVSSVPTDRVPEINALMTNADTAQQEAMERGDLIGVYDEKLQEKRFKQKEIERLMQKAIEKEEFQIWLQPKYDIRTQKIIGAEALARWQSPELGFVMPGLFISLFEKNGFIIEFDYYVLDHVCRLQRRRLDEGHPLVPFSVNQSGLHIREPGYLDRLRATVEPYDLPPGAIDLEITETAFVDFDTQDGRENASSIIAAMKEMGFTVSMDDFCTGYSSIAMLQHLDMDVMKIDRAMLLASEASERGRKIIKQVVSLGQTLNMQVLCEGVETKEQEALLLENGCYYAQGFLFGKPMPAEDYFAFADARSDAS